MRKSTLSSQFKLQIWIVSSIMQWKCCPYSREGASGLFRTVAANRDYWTDAVLNPLLLLLLLLLAYSSFSSCPTSYSRLQLFFHKWSSSPLLKNEPLCVLYTYDAPLIRVSIWIFLLPRYYLVVNFFTMHIWKVFFSIL